jgi:hypothetical protein
MDKEEKDIRNQIAECSRIIRQSNQKILDNEVAIMLMKLVEKSITNALNNKMTDISNDVSKLARKIVAHCREQIQ